MSTLQAGDRIKNRSSSGGSFGKKAAIKWKALKQQWVIILSVAVIALTIKDLMQKNSRLGAKLLVLESRLQHIEEDSFAKLLALESRLRQMEEDSFKTTNALNNLRTTMERKVDRSEYEKTLPQNQQQSGNSTHPARKDFSSFAAGASVIEQLTSPTWSYRRKISPSRLPFSENHLVKITGSAPVTILLSDLSVGTCWSFHGATGQIGIRLSRPIFVEGITIGHVSQALAYDIRTAPAQFQLWGLDRGNSNSTRHLLLESTYNIDSSNNVQYFAVKETTSLVFSAVVLRIKSNHGNPNFTCLYRVQVHGQPESKAEEKDMAIFSPT